MPSHISQVDHARDGEKIAEQATAEHYYFLTLTCTGDEPGISSHVMIPAIPALKSMFCWCVLWLFRTIALKDVTRSTNI